MTFRIKQPDGTWVEVGTVTQPLYIRQGDGTWTKYAGGTGAPLQVKQADGTWLTVTSAGENVGRIQGQVTVAIGDPVGNALVVIEGTPYTYTTAADGAYVFEDVPFGPYTLRATAFGGAGISRTATVDHQNAISVVNIVLPTPD